MFKSGFVLDSTDKLEAAMYNRTAVEVWQDGQIEDYGGQIESVSDFAVKINGSYYPRVNSEFRIR